MRKFGGILLMLVGIILVALAALRAINVLLVFTNVEASAYGIGFIAGTVIFVLLFAALGIKAVKKGRSLMKPAEAVSSEETASD